MSNDPQPSSIRTPTTLPLLAILLLGACAESATMASEADTFLDLTRARIVALSGAQQEGEVAAFLPEPLVVEVRSEGGTPLAGVEVEWVFEAGQGRAAAGGAGGTAATLTSWTDSRGRTGAAWLLGTRAGTQQSSAQVLVPASASQATASGAPAGKGKGNKVGFSAKARPGSVAAIEVTPGSLSMTPGGTELLRGTAVDGFGNPVPDVDFNWRTSSSGVATVDGTGVVTAQGAGEAVVSAKYGPAEGSSTVTVTPGGTTLPAGSTLEVTPSTVSFTGLGETLSLSVTIRDPQGRSLDGYAVSFRSTDPLVVEVDEMGLLTARGVGVAAVVVSTVCCSVADTVSVEVDRVPSAISLSRSSLTLSPGDTAHLSASVLDGNGQPMEGLAIEWAAGDPSIATVDGTGGGDAVVTGLRDGSTSVTAAAQGLSAQAPVTVDGSGGPPTALANECSSPRGSWVWCDDFELDRTGSYFEYATAGGSFARASSVGVGGSTGMRARFAPGQVDAGFLHLALGRTPQSYFRPVDDGTRDYRELYWRVFVRNQPGWTGGGGDKLTRAFIFASPTSWAQAMIAHVWAGGSGSRYLVIDPASGTDAAGNLVTTTYNDFANLRWLGLVRSDTPIFDDAHVGQWQCVEARVRLNDAGQANGVFQLWINGSLEAERTDLNWVGAFDDYGLNAVFLENYWDGGSPVAQERYMDNFVVSTAPVGCGEG